MPESWILRELIVLDVEALAFSLGLSEPCECGEPSWCGPNCPTCDAEGAYLNGLYGELGEGSWN